MENNNFDKERILEKLENKIAIDNFKNDNKEVKDKKKHSFKVVKVASLIIVGTLALGNVITYATSKTDLFTWSKNLILNNIGISKEYEEKKIDTNISKDSNGIKLDITDYGIDNENLIIGYNIKFPKKIDFAKETASTTTIVNGKEILEISDTCKSIFSKISDTEYTVYEIYDIKSSKIKEGSIIKENMKLYDYLGDVDGSVLANWSFEIPIEKDKITTNLSEYKVNKTVNLKEVKNKYTDHTFASSDGTLKLIPKVDISKMKITDIATKLYMKLDNYTTDPSFNYTLEILDINNESLLAKDTEFLQGGIYKTILFKKIDTNQTITLNFYEQIKDDDEKIVTTAKASYKLDLSKLKQTNNKEKSHYTNRVDFFKLSFICWSDDEEYEKMLNESTAGNGDYVGIPIKNNDEISEYIQIRRYKNIFNDSLEKLVEKLKLYEYAGGYGLEKTHIIFDGDKEYEVSDEEFLEYAKKGYINIDGKKINLPKDTIHDVTYTDEKEITIDGNKAYTWTQYYGYYTTKYIMILDGYVYEIDCPNNMDDAEYVEEFINSLKIN